ncbi:hypothetical protein F909_02782 [Acinetobacter sp. ANC 3929]|uniref:hypothetical protein n=1 Tax=unclassified Acinetobacter TaxID=196816 RepID=UPI0002CF34B4|nr:MULTISPECIES: hypothetical protein [unclassified Acinetobacter]ENW81491.1 hypothetical protein F909_02782 [Acinetobacter sp. ANC 3929]MCH7351972.1 hypothetical protein [Acinetobacter sp. NIPH 2023]MCH7354528.1 hypothetical protein [Acinetobacter sp. NIPH 1958]MCH7359650.1 hypothetical protein [Acinetobacter sp. NIPH 2024]
MHKIFSFGLLSLISISLTACGGCPLIAGCNGTDRSPYFISPVSSHARGIPVPPQTKFTYQSQHFRQTHQQSHALKEQNLTGIAFPENTAILWGGMPVERFIQFSNPEMKGFSVYPAIGFKSEQSNAFLNLWKSCESDLSIYLKNPNDWSFNPSNMQIRGCGRYQQRSEYMEDNFRQNEADEFLRKINQALQQLPKQHSYPVIQQPSK